MAANRKPSTSFNVAEKVATTTRKGSASFNVERQRRKSFLDRGARRVSMDEDAVNLDKGRRVSIAETALKGEPQVKRQLIVRTDEEKESLSNEILDEIEFCMNELSEFQKHPSMKSMASEKFKKMLNAELLQLNNTDDTAEQSQVTSYITETYSSKEQEMVKMVRPEASTKRVTVVGSTDAVSVMSTEAKAMDCESDQVNTELWGMDVFQLVKVMGTRVLTSLAFTILKKRDLIKSLNLPIAPIMAYFSKVENRYHGNTPYHNRLHGADVMQSVHVLLNAPSFQNVFSDLEVFASLFAAAIHDVGHPGVNNQFLMNTGADMAVMYNDQSVLENHHLAVGFKLLQFEGCDILQNFNKKTRSLIRRIVIDLVLSTDMTKHIDLVAQIRTRVEMRQMSGGTAPVVGEDYKDRIEVLKIIIHCGDLSNPTKARHLYLNWTQRIMEEFFLQGDRERQLGLDISPLCDRQKVVVSSSQIAFIDFVVFPLWDSLSRLISPDIQYIMDTLIENRTYVTEVRKAERGTDEGRWNIAQFAKAQARLG